MKNAIILAIMALTPFIAPCQTLSQDYLKTIRKNNPDYYSAFRGDFSVSEQGAAIYNIPIFVSPGTGMEPKLSLVYNSNNGTSILGEGWALSGLSLIGRSAANYAQDGFVKPVNFDKDDRLHLDGQRLVLLDSNDKYGNQNTHYRTENNTFRDVEIVEGDLDPESNSLRSFIIRSKDGLIYRYGNSSIGKNDGIVFTKTKLPSGTYQDVPIIWLLKSVKDRNGNWIKFNYEISQNSYYPKDITYGKSQDETASGQIEFIYKQTAWWSNTRYINGQEITLNKYLNEIRCNYASAQSVLSLVRKYNIIYTENPDFQKINISRIYQSYRSDIIIGDVKLNASDEKNQIVFDWAKPMIDSIRLKKAAAISEKLSLSERFKTVLGDVNGDGFPDRIFLKADETDIQLNYSQNNKRNGFHQTKTIKFEVEAQKEYKLFTGDYNADGRIDILITYFKDDDLKAYVISMENGSAEETLKISKSLDLGNYKGTDKKKISIIPGEFNADGYSDLLVYHITDSIRYLPITFYKKYLIKLHPLKALARAEIPENSNLFFNDLNGDGVNDFVFSWTDEKGWYLKSFLFPDSKSFGVTPGIGALLKTTADNKPGEIYYRGKPDTTVTASSITISNGDYSKMKNIFIVDFNKDGNADVLISKADKNGWYCYPAIGKGNGEFQSIDITNGKIQLSTEVFNNDLRTSFGDFNGDGNLDLIIQYSNSQGWFANVAFGNGKGNFYCRNKQSGTTMQSLSNHNFSYSIIAPTSTILPPYQCVYYPMIARQLGEYAPLSGDSTAYYHYLNIFRRGRYVETGFYPNEQFSPYSRTGFDCLGKLFIESVDYENNIKQVENITPIGKSIIPQSASLPNVVPFAYRDSSKITLMDYWQPFVLDFNADGISDLLLTYPVNPTSDSHLNLPSDPLSGQVCAFLSLNESTVSGLINKITHSNRKRINVRYSSQFDYGEDAPKLKPLDYPAVQNNSTVICVRDLGMSSGVKENSIIHTGYSYHNAISNLHGRGFLGFGSTDIKNPRTGISTQKSFDHSIGFVSKGLLPLASITMKSSSSSTPIESSNFEYTIQNGQGNKVFAIYCSKTTTSKNDLNGQSVDQKETSITNDNYGNPIKIVETDGKQGEGYQKRETENTYWESSMPALIDAWILGRLKDSKTTINNEAPTATSYFYDLREEDAKVIGNGQLEREISFLGDQKYSITKTYTLNKYGQITSSIEHLTSDPTNNRTMSTTYSSDQRFARKTTDYEGYTSLKSFNIESGFLESQSGQDEKDIIRYKNDPLGRKSRIEDPDNILTDKEMRLCRRCEIKNATTFTIQESSLSSNPIVSYYDNNERIVRKVIFNITGTKKIITDYIYDDEGNIQSSSLPYFATSTPKWTTYKFDKLNRTIGIYLPDKSVTLHVYAGLSDTLVNANKQIYITKRNLLGQISSTQDADGAVAEYAYTPYGKLAKVNINGQNISEYKYDILGNKISYQNVNFKKTATYRYNCWGEIEESTDPNGNKITFNYDKLGRLTEKAVGRDIITYHYIDAASLLAGKGKLASIESVSLDRHLLNEYFEYQQNGHIKTHTYKIKAGSNLHDRKVTSKNTLKYEFSYNNGQLSSILYPYTALKEDKRLTVRYNYQNGTMVKATSELTGTKINTTLYEILETNASGLVTKYRLGDNIVAQQKFNPLSSKLINLDYSKTADSLVSLSYTYDQIGNVITRSDLLNKLTDSISYDNLNRITNVSTNGYQVALQYYANGDIKEKTYGKEYSFAFRYQNGTNKFSEISQTDLQNPRRNADFDMTKAYDGSGNLLQTFPCVNRYKQQAISYNSYNLPDQIGFHEFYYDYENTKQVIIRQQELYLTLSDLSEIKYDLSSERQFQYQKFNITINGNQVAYILSNDLSIHYLLKDAQNTVVAEIIRIGNKEQINYSAFDIWGLRRDPKTWRYDWGQLRDEYNNAENKGFLNSTTLEGFGLSDLKARMYDPITGRFISVDPLLNLSFPSNQVHNPYLYGLNNPAKFRDSNGKIFGIDDFLVIVVIGAYIGASSSGGSLLPWEWNENWWKGALIGGAAAAGGFYLSGAMVASRPVVSSFGGGFGAAFSSSFTSTIVNGGSFMDALSNGISNGIIGGVTGAFTGFVGHGIPGLEDPKAFSAQYFYKAGAHGLTQGLYSEAMGGGFAHGFMAGVATELIQPAYKTDLMGSLGSGGRTAFSAMAGGSISALGGGKFANGAISGAFVQAFNHESEKSLNESLNETQRKSDFIIEGASTFTSKIGILEEPRFLRVSGYIGTASSAALGAYDIIYNHADPIMTVACQGVNIFVTIALTPEITPLGAWAVGSIAEESCKYIWPSLIRSAN